MQSTLLFLAGLAALIAGAELFVRGAAALAAAIRVSPLVIGLTVVAFGTSAPELAITVQASRAGSGDLALGNVVGSNICNILLILGLSALVTPLVVAARLVRLDVPLLILASIATLLLGLDGSIGRSEGAVLFACIVAYTTWLVRQCRREQREVVREYEEAFADRPAYGPLALRVVLMVVGLVLLVLGSRWLVDAAVSVALSLGVSELVIGLTIVAVGTSLPEVATSVLAGIRGERDIAVGNVIGSSLFNLLCVLGLGAVASPTGVSVPPDALRFDIPVMIAVSIACLPILGSGHHIARWEGGLFLAYYVAYTLHVVLAATRNPALREFDVVMVVFVVPLTIVTLVVMTLRDWWRKRDGGGTGRQQPIEDARTS